MLHRVDEPSEAFVEYAQIRCAAALSSPICPSAAPFAAVRKASHRRTEGPPLSRASPAQLALPPLPGISESV